MTWRSLPQGNYFGFAHPLIRLTRRSFPVLKESFVPDMIFFSFFKREGGKNGKGIRRNKGYQLVVCACALVLLPRTKLAASLQLCLLWAAGRSAVMGCGLCGESPWTAEAWFYPSEKSIGRRKPNNCWDTWKISACRTASVCVHVNRCTTASLNIFSPILQKVINFRSCVSCSISLQYVTSCPFALLIILISLITECLSFGNCPAPQKACARKQFIPTILRPAGTIRS